MSGISKHKNDAHLMWWLRKCNLRVVQNNTMLKDFHRESRPNEKCGLFFLCRYIVIFHPVLIASPHGVDNVNYVDGGKSTNSNVY